MATLEPILYERKQDPVFFVFAVEERADMACLVKLGTSKRYGGGRLLHSLFAVVRNGRPVGVFGALRSRTTRYLNVQSMAKMSNPYFGAAKYPSSGTCSPFGNSRRPEADGEPKELFGRLARTRLESRAHCPVDDSKDALLGKPYTTGR